MNKISPRSPFAYTPFFPICWIERISKARDFYWKRLSLFLGTKRQQHTLTSETHTLAQFTLWIINHGSHSLPGRAFLYSERGSLSIEERKKEKGHGRISFYCWERTGLRLQRIRRGIQRKIRREIRRERIRSSKFNRVRLLCDFRTWFVNREAFALVPWNF